MYYLSHNFYGSRVYTIKTGCSGTLKATIQESVGPVGSFGGLIRMRICFKLLSVVDRIPLPVAASLRASLLRWPLAIGCPQLLEAAHRSLPLGAPCRQLTTWLLASERGGVPCDHAVTGMTFHRYWEASHRCCPHRRGADIPDERWERLGLPRKCWPQFLKLLFRGTCFTQTWAILYATGNGWWSGTDLETLSPVYNLYHFFFLAFLQYLKLQGLCSYRWTRAALSSMWKIVLSYKGKHPMNRVWHSLLLPLQPKSGILAVKICLRRLPSSHVFSAAYNNVAEYLCLR